MGGVDKNDQMKSYYPIPEAGKKWWSRVFYDLMDRSIHNSFVLEQESTHHAKRSQKLFRIDLAKQLIGNFSSRRKRGRPSDEHLLARHIERHFPDFLPTNEKGKRLFVCLLFVYFLSTEIFYPQSTRRIKFWFLDTRAGYLSKILTACRKIVGTSGEWAPIRQQPCCVNLFSKYLA